MLSPAPAEVTPKAKPERPTAMPTPSASRTTAASGLRDVGCAPDAPEGAVSRATPGGVDVAASQAADGAASRAAADAASASGDDATAGRADAAVPSGGGRFSLFTGSG
ncbi:hypothetical protein [Streptomyces sp. NPDC088923]|uniref:hypothetical protein n=1 Tax=Streptomyces sp. NPDC088923 TaxID=3365913 RepID=UPI003817CBD8